MDLTTGQNLLKEKKFFLAKKYFEKLLNLNPNRLEINFYLGRVYSELLDSTNSIKYYKRYLEFNENSINCLINLGIIYLNIGDIINSEKTFRKIINLNKKNVTAFNGLFMLFLFKLLSWLIPIHAPISLFLKFSVGYKKMNWGDK